MKLYCYRTGPIDEWFGTMTQDELESSIDRQFEESARQGVREQLKTLRARAEDCFQEMEWEGDIREGPFYFSVPAEQMHIGYAIKQDNDGTCFLASPVPLDMDSLGTNEEFISDSPDTATTRNLAIEQFVQDELADPNVRATALLASEENLRVISTLFFALSGRDQRLACDKWAVDRAIGYVHVLLRDIQVLALHQQGKMLEEDMGYWVPANPAPNATVAPKRILPPGLTAHDANLRQWESAR